MDDRWRHLSNSPTLSQFTTSVTTMGMNPTLKVASSSVNPIGEMVQVVRPEIEDDFDSNADEIVGNLVKIYGAKKTSTGYDKYVQIEQIYQRINFLNRYIFF